MTEFLAMNGHGPYVFGAYALSALALVAIGAVPLLRLRYRLRTLRRQLAVAEAARGRE